jgi:hypothetical protein
MTPLLPLVILIQAAAIAPEPIDTVSAILAAGAAAETARDGKALLAAADALDAAGAKPVVGTEAMSDHWRALARRLGVRVRTIPYRGRALGPAYRSGSIAAGDVLRTEQVFLAGHKAVVALVPQSSRALDLRIIGDDQASLCARAAEPPRATCAWLPIFTTRVEIRVTNRGPVTTRYFLVSN